MQRRFFAALHVALAYSLLWLWKIFAYSSSPCICHVRVKRRREDTRCIIFYQRQKKYTHTHKCNTMRDKSWFVTEIVMAMQHGNAKANNQPHIHRQHNVPPPDNHYASNCCISNARTHFHFFRYLVLYLYRKWSRFCCAVPYQWYYGYSIWILSFVCLPSKYSVILTVSLQFILIRIGWNISIFPVFFIRRCWICRREV